MDGVLVPTDEYHFQSWWGLAKELGVPFDRQTFDTRMRGLERSDAVRVFLERSSRNLDEEARRELAAAKQRRFVKLMADRPLAPAEGAVELLASLRRAKLKLAVGSSSHNARWVLRVTGLERWFDAIVDGTEARGKPRPDIFLKAAEKLRAPPRVCVVIEDARDGIEAARRAKMAVVAIGPKERVGHATARVARLKEITLDLLSTLRGCD